MNGFAIGQRQRASRQFGAHTVEIEFSGGWVWRCPPRWTEWSEKSHGTQADAYQAARFAIFYFEKQD